jgi:histidinol dehydrogenase
MPSKLKIKVWNSTELPPHWFNRAKATDKKDATTVQEAVRDIITQVKESGDAALIALTEKFDKARLTPHNLRVTPREIKVAYKAVKQEQIEALKLMKKKLEAQERQTLRKQRGESTREGINIQTAMRPLESVGCYVPGGQAAYPSTLVMTATPAKVAGVPRIVVCSPPTEKHTINPLILVAADICGVDEVYKVGGVQAIAALAYGTQSIKPIKKIVGPGSKYVTEAKVQVSQDVAIDLPAGPSEVFVIADETANPRVIAADMISQAEHGIDSIAGLVTTSKRLAKETLGELEKAIDFAERKDIVYESISNLAFIITCTKTSEMITLANEFAPEHLEIITRTPSEIADKINTAGLILTGPFSPVALSDYAAGTNHVLPTGGFGRSFSGLSVLDFTRRISIVESTKEGLKKVEKAIKAMTEAERLPNHLRAVEARFEK